MKKTEAIQVITTCAKRYHTHLVNRNLLFVFGALQAPSYFEAVFLPRHFLHLTGVSLSAERFTGSSDFYRKCLRGRLRSDDFTMPDDGTVEMKLAVLPQLMEVYRHAKMIGDYDFTKSMLYTEKLAGNVSACLGFVQSDGYYMPNTTLREDIRNVTRHPQMRILAIYRKAVRETVYHELCYTAKGIAPAEIAFPDAVREKLQG